MKGWRTVAVLLIVAQVVCAWDPLLTIVANGQPPNNNQVLAGSAQTDGEMHWLREAFQTSYVGHGSTRGTLMVGAANVANGNVQVSGIDTNPQVDPLFTHQEMTNWFALSATNRAYITRNAAAFAPLNVAAPLANVNGAQEFAGCDASIVNALAAAGAARVNNPNTASDRVKARAQLAHIDGTRLTCDIAMTLTVVKRHAAAIVAHGTVWMEHYQRFQALPAVANHDFWVLRDWLYATERARGHRLLGAAGWATAAGQPHANWQKCVVKVQYHGGVESYGMQRDTAGHVRPRSLGGEPDFLNFVPQSRTGQGMVAPGETLAEKLMAHCPANTQIRYIVTFGYAGNPDRRPSSGANHVDLKQNCNDPNLGGAVGAADDLHHMVIAHMY